MKRRMKSILLLTLVSILGLTLVACGGDKPEEPEIVAQEEQEDEDEHTHDAPFEWRGTYEFEEGEYKIKFNKNDGDAHMAMGFLKTDAQIDDFEHHAAHMMDEDSVMEDVEKDGIFEAKHEYAYELELNNETAEFTFTIAEGEYYVFTEHFPEEFDLEIVDADGNVLEATDTKEYDEDYEI